MSGMRREEAERRLYPELQTLLTLPLPDNWEREPTHDGHIVYGVSFCYKGSRRDSVDISYWDNTEKYQTWVYGSTDEQYPTLQEAIDRIQLLMPIVACGVLYSEMASVRNEEYGMRLIDRHGIGRGTITKLMGGFGTLKRLSCATLDEIEEIPGIGANTAWLIGSHLSPNIRHHELWDPSEEQWVDLYQVPEEVMDQCVTTHMYLTQAARNKYQLTKEEIEERGLVKERQ